MTVRTKPPKRSSIARSGRVPTNLSLPADLVAEIDEVAGPRNRSRFVEDALRRAIHREQYRIAGERAAGVFRAEDYPYWRTSEDVVAWVREMRAEETDHGDDA
jgi:metal-responsive CopG/Arc/MetJ family transcriptional regulator